MKSFGQFFVNMGLCFAGFLEREAGYAVMSMMLIAAGLVLVDPAHRALSADRIITFALGVLARSMGAVRKPPAG